MPRISIIVPVYKSELYIHRCIDSILKQTFTDFELLLIDDGSPDSSGKICDEYLKKDKRIRVIHKENEGQAIARNIGLDMAQGDYIHFVDSDDYVHPSILEVLYKNITNYNADISICEYELVYDLDYKYKEFQKDLPIVLNTTDAFRRLFSEKSVCYIAPWAKLYRKRLFHNVKYPEGRICEDGAVVHRLLYNANKVVESDEKLYYYYQSENSTMRSSYTIKNLDPIYAFEDRIKFFNEKGLDEFYVITIKEYLNFLKEHTPKVLEYLNNPSLADNLKNKFRYYFRQNKRRCGFNVKTVPYFYDFLYPRIMMCFWRFYNIYKNTVK